MACRWHVDFYICCWFFLFLLAHQSGLCVRDKGGEEGGGRCPKMHPAQTRPHPVKPCQGPCWKKQQKRAEETPKHFLRRVNVPPSVKRGPLLSEETHDGVLVEAPWAQAWDQPYIFIEFTTRQSLQMSHRRAQQKRTTTPAKAITKVVQTDLKMEKKKEKKQLHDAIRKADPSGAGSWRVENLGPAIHRHRLDHPSNSRPDAAASGSCARRRHLHM